MNKIFIGLVLLCSICQKINAQNNVSGNYPFDIPVNNADRYFWIDLGSGNKAEIYLNDIDDFDKFINMDSIIYGFLKDLKKFEDSLKDESTIKRIDYNLDDVNQRKLRITQYKPAATAFLVTDTEAAEIKLRQDTINFTGKVDFVSSPPLRRKHDDTRYYKIVLLVNNIADVSRYMNNTINQKIAVIRDNIKKRWNNNKDRSYSPSADRSVKSNARSGYYAGTDFLTLTASVDIQNYKASFVPSASIGAAVILGGKNIRREIGIVSEYHFSFGRNAAGENRTFINKFLTLNYERERIKVNEIKKSGYNFLNLSFSYLVDRKGPLFEKNTSRISVGAATLLDGSAKIQPVLYIRDFFKSVTPGIRWVQSF